MQRKALGKGLFGFLCTATTKGRDRYSIHDTQRKAPTNGSKSGLSKIPLHHWQVCGSLVVRTQDKQSISHNPPYLAIASPKHCELRNLQVVCPSEKPDLSDHFLKRSPEKDKQRKWWCKVPVWRKRYYGLIRSDTGQRDLKVLCGSTT